MPAKKNGVITSNEARFIARDPTTMRNALLALQIECGDREDDPRSRILNQTNARRGYYQISEEEFEEVRAIIRKPLDAARERSLRVDESVTRAR